MELLVTIANERLYPLDEGEEYNLFTKEGINGIYDYAEQVDQQGDIYIIMNIDAPWANHDECALVDDIVEVAVAIKDFTPTEYAVFEAIGKTQMHEVLDIVIRIQQGQLVEYNEDIDEDDIWESVIINNKKIVVTH